MTITLNLAPEDEAELNDIAAQKGQNADATAYNLFTAALAEHRAKHQVPANMQPLPETDLTPEEEAEAISIGLDASFAGRVTPLAEWSAKFRARHNIPEGIKPMTHEEAMRLP
jgi:hypothetical protein